ncbi:PREDICTED: protein lingerer isoform X3 [Ceratosolen solmsi marchali]|uniref:Protein lingerer isoform X3 n=1 Tax=Ceratosolen solmsi marchali TaxID=326594 RepID=A0AAJ7E158_9HYME|nr:PREDICTED: protein lingerer isoform X3 [Ceratosolen solmsi marchali]
MSSCNRSLSATKSNSKTKSLQGKADHQIKSSDLLKCDKFQHKSDQLRQTNIIDNRINSKEDVAWQERIKQVMDLTRRSEDEVIMALHDSDGDLNRAVNDLLEGVSPEWEVKKKKARPTGGSKQNSEQSVVSDNLDWEDKRCFNSDGTTRIRGRVSHINRGWRRRENKENEKNIEEIKFETAHGNSRRGRGISGRSGRGGRGGGRGLGPRTFANRGESISSNSHTFNRPIDTWTGNEEHPTNLKEIKKDSWSTIDTTEDWDSEEYTGSLADTKVFTPSTLINENVITSDKKKCQEMSSIKIVQSSNLLIPSESSKLLNQENIIQEQSCQSHKNIASIHLPHSLDNMNRGSLSAAQSEYFTQLSQQSSDCLNVNSGHNTFLNVPQRQIKHRPRLPPPSKIPSTAVEMPGDALNTSIGFLDVQFGALEFGADANINDGSNQEKFNSSGSNSGISCIEQNSITTKTVVNSLNSLSVEAVKVSCQKFNPTSKLLLSDNQNIANEHSINSQSGFTSRNTPTQSMDMQKQDLNSQTSLSNSTFDVTVTYQSSKPSYPTSVTACNYNAYSCNVQANPTSFTCPTTSCNSNNFSVIPSVSQTGYNSSYTQSSITTFSQTSSCNTSGIYNQTPTTSQGYQSTSGFTTPISQYQSQSASTNTSSNNSYINTVYPNSSTFQSTAQPYQPSNTTFTSSISQGTSVYSNTVQSVYSNAYPSYGCQNQAVSQDHKPSTNKELSFESNTTTSSTSLVTTTCTLSLTSSSVNTSQTKTTMSNAVPKSSVNGLVPNNNNSSSSISGSGTSGNIAPILSHQYIMGQSVPYATFQQPHMYSYEDLQLMQQRLPHMPTTGYYDAALGYQTTGPVTSLGNSRNDALSGVQGVQGVQPVQGQYTSINDARFARTDSNASPVSSTMSQQTATQHQQPLMNPIPPGYAYFYGGGIMPASGFQYGTPAIYPQIATAGNAATSSGGYNTKPGNYGSGYGSGTNYDALSNSGPSGDYKNTATGFSTTQTSKTGSSSGNTSTAGTSTDINTTMYTKGHVALNKVNVIYGRI